MTITKSGNCPECLKMVTEKGECLTCKRLFDMETGAQQPNASWKIRDGRFVRQPLEGIEK
jgi:hypothetical protein